jgi:hypothetical protein
MLRAQGLHAREPDYAHGAGAASGAGHVGVGPPRRGQAATGGPGGGAR